ncbi:MAG: DUF4845 domain-containing protein [Chromatiaceae bacterium]|nr:DUF4845 domain-containing protein [Chromatiaceae bacterium]
MSMQRQAGKGLASIMFLILIAAFFLTLLFKLGPLYMNYWTVRSIMNGLVEAAETGGVQKNPPAITKYIMSNLDINSVSGFTDKDFVIKRKDEKTFTVSTSYERREHLFFNVDAVLVFEKSVEIPAKP